MVYFSKFGHRITQKRKNLKYEKKTVPITKYDEFSNVLYAAAGLDHYFVLFRVYNSFDSQLNYGSRNTTNSHIDPTKVENLPWIKYYFQILQLLHHIIV